MAISFDLKKHDERFHPNGYDETKGTCKFRERIKDYESVDTLEGNQQDLEDAFEDLEVLERLMANAPEDAKKRLQTKVDEIEQRIKKGGSAKGAATGASAVTQFGPNPVIPHDTKAFPDKNDAKWFQALENFGSPKFGWREAGGSTGCQKIEFGGKTYFVKMAGAEPNHSGIYSYDNSAVENEVAANQFLRLAGFNAPDSELYKTPKCANDHTSGNNGTYYCVTTESDISGNDVVSPQTKDEKKQLKDFYPLAALIYNADMMAHSGNAFFDKNGKLVPLDNGCAFGFSSQGERDPLRKFKFDYDGRVEADFTKNPKSGLMALAQWGAWSNAIDTTNQDKMLKHAAKYNMGELVREAKKKGILSHLPTKCVDSLTKFADELDKLSAKYKQPKATPTPQSVVQQPVKSEVKPQPQPQAASTPTTTPATVSATATQASPASVATSAMTTSNVPMPSAHARKNWLLGHQKVWDESYHELKKEVRDRGFSDDDEELATALGKVPTVYIRGGWNGNGVNEPRYLDKIGYDTLVGYLKPLATKKTAASTPAATPNASSAVQRLQTMMANPNLNAGQKMAYQNLINRLNGNGANNATNTQTTAPSQTVASNQPTTTSTPTQTAVTPPKASTANASPKLGSAISRMQAMLNRKGATPSQRKSYQAMLNRLNGSAI